MRHIGTIAEKKQAERCVHCLDAQQIEATWRPLQETGDAVWVLDEARVTTRPPADRARSIDSLVAF
jgi:hypothetical protein